MPTGIPRHPVVRSIDCNLTEARREIRRLEAARAALVGAPSYSQRRRIRRRRPDRVTRMVLAELDAGLRPVA